MSLCKVGQCPLEDKTHKYPENWCAETLEPLDVMTCFVESHSDHKAAVSEHLHLYYPYHTPLCG